MGVVLLACRVGRRHDLEQKQRRESELCFSHHRESPFCCMYGPIVGVSCCETGSNEEVVSQGRLRSGELSQASGIKSLE
jgi:hypothetical protein